MEKYKQVEYLGYESIGEVWLVENKKTTELFAMKCFKRGHQVHSCIYLHCHNLKTNWKFGP